MPESTPSRRAVLRTGGTLGGLAAAGGLSGCLGILGDGSGAGRVDAVPEDATTVLYANVSGFLDDDSVRESIDEQIETFASATGGSDSPDSVEGVLDQIESEVGLDPRELNELITFGEAGSSDSFGAVVWTDWSEDDLTDAVEENGSDLEEDSYEGSTIYEGESGDLIGVLEDGTYAIGSEGVVEDAIDVHNGDADPVGGEVRSAYENTRDGYLRFAFTVDEDLVPEESGGQFDISVFEDVESGYGSIASGDTAFQVTLSTTDADSAENVADVIEGGLATAEDQIEGRESFGSSGEELVEQLLSAIENTEVSRDGSDVTVATSGDVGTVVAIVAAVVGSFVLGFGGSQQVTPTASFSFEYDATADTVEITHEGGDTIAASELFVRGTGFTSASGADMTGPGRWRGSTSSSIDGQPAVVAGDRVTVGLRSDGELRLVWRGDSSSATLAAYEGPDA